VGISVDNVTFSAYIPDSIKLDIQVQRHIERCLLNISGYARKVVMSEYVRLYQSEGLQVANLYLLELRRGGSTQTRFETPAHKLAFECAEIIRIAGYKAGEQFFREHGLSVPVGKLTVLDDPERQCVIARMIDPDVWARKLKIEYRRKNATAVYNADNNNVCRGGEFYCPDFVVENYIENQKDSAVFLSHQIVVSDEGDEMILADVVASSVSNPENRRHEMMTRMSGMEDFSGTMAGLQDQEAVASSVGFVCIFFTLTSPSCYHRKRWVVQLGRAIDNPNYKKEFKEVGEDGEILIVKNSPRVALDQQAKVKARVRAKLKRENIDILGFSVVEPHHDGTPHQHLAVFVHPDNSRRVKQIFKHYALQEDGDELGARVQPKPTEKRKVIDKDATRRLDIMDHDPKKGSVTAYMVKYISKGIAGFGIGEDFEVGVDCDDSVLRILAWKSLYGFRQFSFFGSPSVTLWRELRRVKEPFSNEAAEEVRLAADEGNWGRFTELVKKYDVSLMRAYVVDETGDEVKNKYGEPLQRVVGVHVIDVNGSSQVIRTRFKEWFLIDIEKLEQRVVEGIPVVADRSDERYLTQISDLMKRAKDEGKVQRIYAGMGGIVPSSVNYRLVKSPILLDEETRGRLWFNSKDQERVLLSTPSCKLESCTLGVL